MNVVFIQYVNKLRERRGNPYTLFILYALHTLAEYFFNNHSQVFPCLAFRYFIQVHEHGYKWSLSITGHQSNQLVLNGLNTALYFFCQTMLYNLVNHCIIQGFTAFFPFFYNLLPDLLAAYIYKGCQMGQCEGLSAVLIGCYLRNNLGSYVAGSEEAVRLFNHGLADNGSVLQHIFQIDKVAVMFTLSKVVRIMEMNDAFLVCLHNLFRQEETFCQVLGYFTSHIIALCGVNYRVLIGIFLLYFFIRQVNQRKDSIIRSIGLTGDFSLITITDILLGYFVGAHFHDAAFHHILNIFYVYRMKHIIYRLGYGICYSTDLKIIHLVKFTDFPVGCSNRIDNLMSIKCYFLTISLYNSCLYFNQITLQRCHIHNLHKTSITGLFCLFLLRFVSIQHVVLFIFETLHIV